MVRAAVWMKGLVPDAAERQVCGGSLYAGTICPSVASDARQRGCCSACELRSDTGWGSALWRGRAGETQGGRRQTAVGRAICGGSVLGKGLLSEPEGTVRCEEPVARQGQGGSSVCPDV